MCYIIYVSECQRDQITKGEFSMLMTPPNALLDQLYEQTDELRKSILSTSHEPDPEHRLFYISPRGNDSNDGLSPATPWKTLAALDASPIPAGSEVLFERSGIWRGKFKALPGVTYSSYGSGEKPRIYGSPLDGAKTGHWREIMPGVWRYSRKLTDDCGGIVFDGGEKHGIKITQRFNPDGSVVDHVSGRPFESFEALADFDDLSFFHDLGREQCHNDDGGRIYLRSDENPAERFGEIEFLTRGNVIRIAGDGVTIDDLCIMYGGSHGIGSGTVSNLTVKNCVIGWIGGSIQFYRDGRPTRFGNGVEIYGGCNGYLVEHCWIYQIYDAGATHQLSTGGDSDCAMTDVEYSDNLIEYCTYNIEYFLGAAVNPSAVRKMSDIRIKNNILRYAGFGWGNQRPDKTAAAHIKGWDSRNEAEDFLIEGNNLICSRYMMIHCGFGEEKWSPVFRSNTFLQYSDGELGRYGKSPTSLMPYDSENVSAGEFAGNEFYILRSDD